MDLLERVPKMFFILGVTSFVIMMVGFCLLFEAKDESEKNRSEFSLKNKNYEPENNELNNETEMNIGNIRLQVNQSSINESNDDLETISGELEPNKKSKPEEINSIGIR